MLDDSALVLRCVQYNTLADQAQRLETEKVRLTRPAQTHFTPDTILCPLVQTTLARRSADRDQLFSELDRTRAVKEKLEELCRQLQKQSRDVQVRGIPSQLM